MDLLNNFVSNDLGWGLKDEVNKAPLYVLRRKDCSRVHYDYDDQTHEVKLLVTLFLTIPENFQCQRW